MTIHEHHHRHELDGVLWTALSSTVPDSAKAVLIINGYSEGYSRLPPEMQSYNR